MKAPEVKISQTFFALSIIVALVSVFSLVFLAKDNTDLRNRYHEMKKQRDDLRKALIKGNSDILKARKILNEKSKIVLI